jgi:hypothetical protein
MFYKPMIGGMAVILSLGLLPSVPAQDRDRFGDRDNDRVTRLEPGTVIPVRLQDSIDVEQRDNRVYTGIVDQDVRGQNGRLAIPRGSTAELIVRVAPDNDLILDFESVVVNGQRYAIKTEPNRVQSDRDNSLVGAIVGAINGGAAAGPNRSDSARLRGNFPFRASIRHGSCR